jgi:hypothetical protein
VIPRDFAELLKDIRLASGLTQEALAERAGISARAVSDLEVVAGERLVWRRSACWLTHLGSDTDSA